MIEANRMKEQTAEIVAAYLGRNTVMAKDVPALIAEVYQSLTALGPSSSGELQTTGPLEPAVPIRRSVTKDFVTCLECGAKGSMLKRHLQTAHNLTPESYRQRWHLPVDYPMVAPNYAARRSELAKAAGLGKRTSGKSPGAKNLA
jgi:predicted transcriptional regulator